MFFFIKQDITDYNVQITKNTFRTTAPFNTSKVSITFSLVALKKIDSKPRSLLEPLIKRKLNVKPKFKKEPKNTLLNKRKRTAFFLSKPSINSNVEIIGHLLKNESDDFLLSKDNIKKSTISVSYIFFLKKLDILIKIKNIPEIEIPLIIMEKLGFNNLELKSPSPSPSPFKLIKTSDTTSIPQTFCCTRLYNNSFKNNGFYKKLVNGKVIEKEL